MLSPSTPPGSALTRLDGPLRDGQTSTYRGRAITHLEPDGDSPRARPAHSAAIELGVHMFLCDVSVRVDGADGEEAKVKLVARDILPKADLTYEDKL